MKERKKDRENRMLKIIYRINIQIKVYGIKIILSPQLNVTSKQQIISVIGFINVIEN